METTPLRTEFPENECPMALCTAGAVSLSLFEAVTKVRVAEVGGGTKVISTNGGEFVSIPANSREPNRRAVRAMFSDSVFNNQPKLVEGFTVHNCASLTICVVELKIGKALKGSTGAEELADEIKSFAAPGALQEFVVNAKGEFQVASLISAGNPRPGEGA